MTQSAPPRRDPPAASRHRTAVTATRIPKGCAGRGLSQRGHTWTASPSSPDTDNTRARRAAADLIDRYAFVAEASADVGVVVGGDGFMLHTLHRLLDDQRALPLYGRNYGTVGFLLNRYQVRCCPATPRSPSRSSTATNAPSTPPPTTRRSPTSARSSSHNDPTAR